MNIKKHIPNTITCCNLLSGTIAVICAYNGHFDLTVLFVLLSAVFDFFDGFSARLLGVSSAIGKELDSLADLISFGFAPSMAAFTLLARSEWEWTRYFALIMVAFSALRLAKFNLDERQTSSFIGLATPANAIFWVGLAYSYGEIGQLPTLPWVILAMLALSCFLLVCELPMFSLKFKTWGWQGNQVRWIFIGGVVILATILRQNALPYIIVWYSLLSICDLASKKIKG
jgi:CDP-diacylglycerol---serine O-phosphatidyltransferase